MNKTGKGGFKDNPQNINMEGKPKGVRSIPDILRKVGQEQWYGKDGKSYGEKIEVILRKVYSEALDGKSWAVQFIADRTEGKAKEFRETTVKTEPIKVFEFED